MSPPVTNGSADTGDPAVVAIITASGDVGCTATVIGPHTALTAAHCVANRDPLALQLFFGSSIDAGGLYLDVSDARIHPGFNPGGGDIALMTIRQPVRVVPVALGGPLDATLVGTSFRAVGFGITGPGAGDEGIKREGTARIATLQPEELVARPGPSLSCLGDSGGPALLDSGTIIGVVSRVDAACVDHAVYTRVDAAQDVLIAPYLAETAPGAAGEGKPCFYADHCAAGLECVGDLERVCEPDAGCGCSSGSDPAAWLPAVVVLALAHRSRMLTRKARAGRLVAQESCRNRDLAHTPSSRR